MDIKENNHYQARIGRPDAGLTLVEIMVATGVLVTALVMVMGAMLHMMEWQRATEEQHSALNTTTSIIEEMRNMNTEDLLVYNPNIALYQAQAEGLARRTPQIQLQIDVINPDTGTTWQLPATQDGDEAKVLADQLPDPYKVRVIITWHDSRGHLRRAETTTTMLKG